MALSGGSWGTIRLTARVAAHSWRLACRRWHAVRRGRRGKRLRIARGTPDFYLGVMRGVHAVAARRGAVTGRLSYAALDRIPRHLRPRRDPRARPVAMVHLGVGAFHRAHQAVYTEECGDWGIAGFTQRSRAVADRLVPQDGLYTLLVRGDGEVRAAVIGAIRQVAFAGAGPAALVARLADPAVTVVTLTVTEKGYRHDPATGRLRLADPQIAADLAGRPPRTVVGQLAAGLAARAAAGHPPLSVVCCDNLPSNGATLRGLVEQYAEQYAGQNAGPARREIADSMGATGRFPATMVDRIRPAATH